MAQTIHNISTPNDGLGDELRTAFDHQNEMNTELYNTKVDKVPGKGLSTNDYTNAEKTKLSGIEDGAQVNVKSDWNATSGDAEILNKPEQLFASVGFFDYNDLATQTTPLNYTDGIELQLENDTLGDNTNISQAPYGVSTIWDEVTNAFDFNSLSIGDTIDLRVDLSIKTLSPTSNIAVYLRIAEGTANQYDVFVGEKYFKEAVDFKNIKLDVGFYIGNEDVRITPAKLILISDDTNGSVKVNGWYTRVIRKDINVISFLNDDTKLDKDILDYDAVSLPLVDSDKFLVNRVGTWYKVDKSELGGGGDFLEKDIATYPIASFPLADTDKLILFQGGVPKKIDKSDIHKETTITVELMNSLTSDFYAPNDLIIHSTDIIRGSGTISLKVEDVAYTLRAVNNTWNKITVETTTPSVYNLNTTPTNANWQRPADWLPMPTNITAIDQTFVGLHAVIENSDNYCAFSFTTSAGQYQVDWGDGNVTLHNSNTIAQHQYDYATVSNATLSSRGYKQAMVIVTAVSGDLLTCNFQQRFVTTPAQNQAYSSGFLECILSMPNASTGGSIVLGGSNIRHAYCEKVDIKTIGNATNMANMLQNCYSLQSVPLFNTSNVTNMSGMFFNCYSLQSVPLFNTSNVTNMSYMFANCYSLQSVPLFNTSNVTSMVSMFQYCYSLQSVPLFNTSNATSMLNMFRSCYSLQSVPLFNTSNVTSMVVYVSKLLFTKFHTSFCNNSYNNRFRKFRSQL